MGIIIKKFSDYLIKEDEDALGSISRTENDFDEDFDNLDVEDTTYGSEGAQDENELNYNDDYIDDETSMDNEDVEEEDPGYEGGRMLMELARKLGKKVVNNEINYNGSTITCYSEDNRFRLNDQIIGDTVEEALETINGGKGNDVESLTESRRFKHSYRCRCNKCI